MQIDDLKYTLLPKNISPEPREIRLGRRDRGRMIVVDRQSKQQSDSYVLELPSYFEEGDVLVLNNSKRVPGILKGTVASNNAQVELQFVGIGKGNISICRIYPTHHIQKGSLLHFGEHTLQVTGERLTSNQLYEVSSTGEPIIDILKKMGFPINAFFSSNIWDVDYLNPFYAKHEGSIESPLAGLHFTPELLETISQRGVQICYVTLHSVGSWLPFLENDIDDHKVFQEEFEMPEDTADIINTAKASNKRVTVCGSTAMRTVESAADQKGKVTAQKGKSGLYIKPGYTFRVADRYFTNFHQYKTSLMVLDAAFCGQELLMESIEVAKERGYIFYEYGDAVFYI